MADMSTESHEIDVATYVSWIHALNSGTLTQTWLRSQRQKISRGAWPQILLAYTHFGPIGGPVAISGWHWPLLSSVRSQ